ncbi:hypothetical protein CVT26_011821 [Gymnopilus dilepis]|uniref:Uncharacterized protein n=1 Tax=Gymnopilus dilepis TaxID=231916 RepID=A0A409XAE9_9AGAR|nr:hypothetical protein CVT26_011821 [Gymnopilus dilepis]
MEVNAVEGEERGSWMCVSVDFGEVDWARESSSEASSSLPIFTTSFNTPTLPSNTLSPLSPSPLLNLNRPGCQVGYARGCSLNISDVSWKWSVWRLEEKGGGRAERRARNAAACVSKEKCSLRVCRDGKE